MLNVTALGSVSVKEYADAEDIAYKLRLEDELCGIHNLAHVFTSSNICLNLLQYANDTCLLAHDPRSYQRTHVEHVH